MSAIATTSRKKRYKTIELIIEETDWAPTFKPNKVVLAKVEWGEVEMGWQIKRAGGKWNTQQKAWELAYSQVVKLGLEKRGIGGA